MMTAIEAITKEAPLTIEETINIINEHIELNHCEFYARHLYIAAKIAIAALEKQISKPPLKIEKGDSENRVGICPCCYAGVDSDDKGDNCTWCGQALDWRVE